MARLETQAQKETLRDMVRDGVVVVIQDPPKAPKTPRVPPSGGVRTRSADQEDIASSVMSEDSLAGNESDAERRAPTAASSAEEGEIESASEGEFANFNAA